MIVVFFVLGIGFLLASLMGTSNSLANVMQVVVGSGFLICAAVASLELSNKKYMKEMLEKLDALIETKAAQNEVVNQDTSDKNRNGFEV